MRLYDNSGNLAIGGLVYTYAAGTSTPATTYTDSTGTTPNTNPVVANSRGEVSIWLATGQAYKLVAYDASSNLLWSKDQIANSSYLSGNAGAASIGTSGGQTVQQLFNAFANDMVFTSNFGENANGTIDDTAVINLALATGADVHLTAGKTYLVVGQLNFTTQGQTIYFHGATLNIQTAINFNANNITVDLGGGSINGWLHVAQLSAQAAVAQNVLQVVNASQIQVGDVLYSSYGDNISNFPLAAGIAVTAVNYSTNTITLASNLTGTVPLPVGVYVGTFQWSAMFGTNSCKNLKFKNGNIGNSPAYFFSSWRWQSADFLTNIPTIFCENINFGNTGYDMFIFAQTQVKFDHCNFGINYDVAKTFIAYCDGANIELNWCNISRGNYDPDFIAISNDGRNTWFKSTNGKIVANDCNFDGTNKLPGSTYFNSNSLHTIVFNSAGGTYNGSIGPSTTYFPGFNFARCKFTNYTRSLLSTTLTADSYSNILGYAIFDKCEIYTQPWQLMVTSGKTFAVGNFSFNNCDIFSSGGYACAQSSYPIYTCKFNNCSLNVTGSVPLFQNSELNDCNLNASPVLWLDPTSRARDLIIDSTSKVGPQYTYSNFPVKGSFIVNSTSFANTSGTISNIIPGSSSGVYGQSNDITMRSGNGTLIYNLTKYNGTTYAWANLKEGWPGYFTGLYGDDWCLFGQGAEVTGAFGVKYKSSYGLLAATTASAVSGASSIVVNSVSYAGNQPVVGDFVFIQMADGTVFSTKIPAGYTTGALTITLTNTLPAAVNTGAGVSFLRLTQL